MFSDLSFNLNEKGAELCFKGEFSQALVCFDKALSFNPYNTDALFSRAGCLIELERYNEAFNDFTEILRIDPNDNMAKTSAIIAESKYNIKSSSLNNYLTAFECNEFGVAIYNSAEQKDTEELFIAKLMYNKSIELDPQFPEPYNNRGVISKQDLKFKDALKDFKMAIKLNPRYSHAIYNMAECHLNELFLFLNMGRFLEILNPVEMYEGFERVLEIEPHDSDAKNAIEKLKNDYGIYRHSEKIVIPAQLKKMITGE